MNLRKVLFALGTAALCTTAFTNAIARDVLRVGTEPTFAPFEYLDSATKTYAGYDMDLIRAVADKAGYDVEIINMGFDALIPALSSGTIDVIAAGVSITEERAKRVDFTTPYYTTGLSILVRKTDAGTLKTMKDLEGKRIAVQIGTTGAEKDSRPSRDRLLPEEPAPRRQARDAAARRRGRRRLRLRREEGQRRTSAEAQRRPQGRERFGRRQKDLREVLRRIISEPAWPSRGTAAV